MSAWKLCIVFVKSHTCYPLNLPIISMLDCCNYVDDFILKCPPTPRPKFSPGQPAGRCDGEFTVWGAFVSNFFIWQCLCHEVTFRFFESNNIRTIKSVQHVQSEQNWRSINCPVGYRHIHHDIDLKLSTNESFELRLLNSLHAYLVRWIGRYFFFSWHYPQHRLLTIRT